MCKLWVSVKTLPYHIKTKKAYTIKYMLTFQSRNYLKKILHFVRNCKFFSSFSTSCCQNFSTVSSCHSLTETMLVHSLTTRRLVCSFHCSICFIIFSKKLYFHLRVQIYELFFIYQTFFQIYISINFILLFKYLIFSVLLVLRFFNVNYFFCFKKIFLKQMRYLYNVHRIYFFVRSSSFCNFFCQISSF